MTNAPLVASTPFRLRLPTGWREVSLEPASLAQELAATNFADPVAASTTVAHILRLAGTARKEGAVFVAGYTRSLPASPLGIVLAEVALVTRDLEKPVNFDVLEAAVIARASSAADRRLEPPVPCQLANGPAIRDRRISAVARLEGEGTYDLFECQYHFLIDEGAATAVLAFASPNIDLIESLTELFEAIAATLQLGLD